LPATLRERSSPMKLHFVSYSLGERSQCLAFACESLLTEVTETNAGPLKSCVIVASSTQSQRETALSREDDVFPAKLNRYISKD